MRQRPSDLIRHLESGPLDRGQVVGGLVQIRQRLQIGIGRAEFLDGARGVYGRARRGTGAAGGRRPVATGFPAARWCGRRRPADDGTRRRPAPRSGDPPRRSTIICTNWGTSSGTSQLVAYAASARSCRASRPAHKPSSGPRPSRRSRTTWISRGSGGNSCCGAATTTSGLTTSPSSRTTRCSINSGPNGKLALGQPIRLLFPPQRMIPPVITIARTPSFMRSACPLAS